MPVTWYATIQKAMQADFMSVDETTVSVGSHSNCSNTSMLQYINNSLHLA